VRESLRSQLFPQFAFGDWSRHDPGESIAAASRVLKGGVLASGACVGNPFASTLSSG
jgi:hypothetical protein